MWIWFAGDCGYMAPTVQHEMEAGYQRIIGGLVKMTHRPGVWCIPASR